MPDPSSDDPAAAPDAPKDPAPAGEAAPETVVAAAVEPGVHPDIVAMEEALDRGDHVRTRELAAGLAATDDPKLKATGEAMLERLKLDPVIVAVMVATGLLMLALALGYLGPR